MFFNKLWTIANIKMKLIFRKAKRYVIYRMNHTVRVYLFLAQIQPIWIRDIAIPLFRSSVSERLRYTGLSAALKCEAVILEI